MRVTRVSLDGTRATASEASVMRRRWYRLKNRSRRGSEYPRRTIAGSSSGARNGT